MEIIKILTNGKKQGIFAITKKEDVTDAILDQINNSDLKDKEFLNDLLKTHLKKGFCIIPKTETPFDWDENIHGKF